MIVETAQFRRIAGAGFEVAEDLGGQSGTVEPEPFDRAFAPEGDREPCVSGTGQQRANGGEGGGFIEQGHRHHLVLHRRRWST